MHGISLIPTLTPQHLNNFQNFGRGIPPQDNYDSYETVAIGETFQQAPSFHVKHFFMYSNISIPDQSQTIIGKVVFYNY